MKIDRRNEYSGKCLGDLPQSTLHWENFEWPQKHFLHLKVFFLTVRYDSYLKTSISFADMSDFFLPMESEGIYRPQR